MAQGRKINVKLPMYGDAAGRPRMVETYFGAATGSVTTEWDFHSSAAGEGKALPMLTTRFDPAVDVHNRQPAEVRRDHDHWTVTVRHPGSGYASLRARTSDVDGNRLTQTVVRVYQIG